MAAETLTPISDVELDEVLAEPGPIGDALARRRLAVAQALRVAEARSEPFAVGRIDRPPGAKRTFFDPRTVDDEPEIVLQRIVDDKENEKFLLRTRIGYADEDLGTFIVPADRATFHSDLMSVPPMFAWLVPQTGLHLPAALVHDAMTPDRGQVVRHYIGPEVDRVAADRIFRDGMRDLGTSIIRRWIVWTAVAIASAWADPRFVRRWWWRFVIALSAITIVTLGGLATIDLFDCRADLPWMGDRPLGEELLFGAGMAVAVPAVLSVLWLRRWRAGVIGGVALALVLHVTLVIVVLISTYTVLENLLRLGHRDGPHHRRPRAGELVRAALGLLVAGVVPIVFLWWACH